MWNLNSVGQSVHFICHQCNNCLKADSLGSCLLLPMWVPDCSRSRPDAFSYQMMHKVTKSSFGLYPTIPSYGGYLVYCVCLLFCLFVWLLSRYECKWQQISFSKRNIFLYTENKTRIYRTKYNWSVLLELNRNIRRTKTATSICSTAGYPQLRVAKPRYTRRKTAVNIHSSICILGMSAHLTFIYPLK